MVAVEKVESCAITFSANHPEVRMFNQDIRSLGAVELAPWVGKIDIVTAGMPCETFSTAGSSSRQTYDHRQVLFKEGIRIADFVGAPFLLLENVPAITTKKLHRGGDRLVLDEIADCLDEFGYQNRIMCVLNAADFGIPQFRKRFFILASRLDVSLRSPKSLFSKSISVQDAFEGLPEINANDVNYSTTISKHSKQNAYVSRLRDPAFWKSGTLNSQISYHVPPKHRPRTLKRFALIEQGEGLKDLFEKFGKAQTKRLQEDGILPNRWYIQRNRRLVSDSKSPTVTSHCLDELIHPFKDRSVTVREAARLQSFPDHYDFAGGPFICPHIYETQDKYEQIGDAVPPLLAFAWGETIAEMIGESREPERVLQRDLQRGIQAVA